MRAEVEKRDDMGNGRNLPVVELDQVQEPGPVQNCGGVEILISNMEAEVVQTVEQEISPKSVHVQRKRKAEIDSASMLSQAPNQNEHSSSDNSFVKSL